MWDLGRGLVSSVSNKWFTYTLLQYQTHTHTHVDGTCVKGKPGIWDEAERAYLKDVGTHRVIVNGQRGLVTWCSWGDPSSLSEIEFWKHCTISILLLDLPWNCISPFPPCFPLHFCELPTLTPWTILYHLIYIHFLVSVEYGMGGTEPETMGWAANFLTTHRMVFTCTKSTYLDFFHWQRAPNWMGTIHYPNPIISLKLYFIGLIRIKYKVDFG